MTERNRPGQGSRVLRFGGRALGILAGAALVAVLAVLGTVAWITSVALPHHQHEADAETRRLGEAAAAAGRQDLARLVADGRLTDDEITYSVGRTWDITRADASWAIVAEIDYNLCIRYDVSLPLGPASTVTMTRLASCPSLSGTYRPYPTVTPSG
ncbi:hypothetical protein [Paractinoplanes globisporus]|uniref:Uncharacterized protein n=1 Tax=Paractinoplanes globisporus TaxID=113565 RepID=A0ABW6WX97_9ACTN|nr:hypothetical protein [Actinoplanes globisporus]